jgi:hypothetical protein
MMRQKSSDTTVLYLFPDIVLDSSDSPDDHEARGRKRRADEDEDEDQASENDTSKPVLKRGTSRASKRQRLNACKVVGGHSGSVDQISSSTDLALCT